LEADHFDIAMAGVYGTAQWSESIRFSDPYLFATMALVVPDHQDMLFATKAGMRAQESFRIGVHSSLADGELVKDIQAEFPNMELVVLDSYRDFFEQRGAGEGLDALFTGAESGSAWTLLYPKYQVVTPFSDKLSLPLVYPFSSGGGGAAMDEFIDHWVLLKQRDGIIDDAYDHWILGKGTEKREPRWSVIRNVFGWVD
jgi:ABC-type amino acid transport substrate-binding protein